MGQFRAGSKRGRADKVRDICHFRFCPNNGEMDVSNAGELGRGIQRVRTFMLEQQKINNIKGDGQEAGRASF